MRLRDDASVNHLHPVTYSCMTPRASTSGSVYRKLMLLIALLCAANDHAMYNEHTQEYDWRMDSSRYRMAS